MPDCSLSPAVFAILAALIEERSGLHFGPDKRDVLADRVAVRALDLGFESPLDYYYYFEYDDSRGAEAQGLVESLAVHESYLFREVDQLEVAVELLDEAVTAGARPRAWSAACASGEEPFSLALLLAARGILDRVEVVASDLSGRALARAREGDLTKRSLRSAPPPAVAGWIDDRGDRVRIAKRIVDAVTWRQANLVRESELEPLGAFDVILCRNVLIYFRDETAQQVVSALTRRLRPRGALFLGVSESLIRFHAPELEHEERRSVFFHRKAEPR